MYKKLIVNEELIRNDLPAQIKKIFDLANDFYGQEMIAGRTFFPARYTPFPGLALPRYTRYFTDGRAANLELLLDEKIYSVRVYGANIYGYSSMVLCESDFPGIADEEAEDFKIFEQIKEDPRKFLRAYTLPEAKMKYDFLKEIQAKYYDSFGKFLPGLPVPIEYAPVSLDIDKYQKKFFEHGRIIGYNDKELKYIFEKNISRIPYQMIICQEGISMRIRDLTMLVEDEDEQYILQKKFEPILLQLYGEKELTLDTLKVIFQRFCNSLISAMNFIHESGMCIWRKSDTNNNMGSKDISITGNVFDPEPITYDKDTAADDKFEIFFAIMSFIDYFQYKFPESELISLANEMIYATGYSNKKKYIDDYLFVLIRSRDLLNAKIKPWP